VKGTISFPFSFLKVPLPFFFLPSLPLVGGQRKMGQHAFPFPPPSPTLFSLIFFFFFPFFVSLTEPEGPSQRHATLVRADLALPLFSFFFRWLLFPPSLPRWPGRPDKVGRTEVRGCPGAVLSPLPPPFSPFSSVVTFFSFFLLFFPPATRGSS